MLRKLEITNFKSWQKLDIKLAPLTVLFGTNSSGKSSILQFLLMLKQTKESSDRSIALDFGNDQKSINLGSFKDAVYKHNEKADITWMLDWRQNELLKIADPEGKRSDPKFKGNILSIECSVRLRNKVPVCDSLSYNFDTSSFSLKRKPGDKNDFKLDADGYKFIRTLGRAWELPGPVKSYAFPDQVRTYYQNSLFLADLEKAYEEQLDKILHLGPLRDYPKRQYTWAGSSPLDVGRRGEGVVDAIMAATARKEVRNLRPMGRMKTFQEMIAFWLKEMGLINSFRVEEVGNESGLYRVYVKKDANSAETLITDVGFGVSQILPVLTLLYYVPEGSTVLLEQPEIHLHPAVQASLADLIITTVQHRKLQIIVESHSEHFLHRLTRRIAEKNNSDFPAITEEEIKLYFCSMKAGQSHLEPLDLDLFGNIGNWPKDFFGDAFGEIAAREKAAIKREMEAK